MKEPIFARTQYHYDSYVDFWRLVEASEFKICTVDKMDLESDNTYITTPINGEHRPHITHRRSILKGPQKAKIIAWNLERPDGGRFSGQDPSGAVKEVYDDLLKYFDAVWASDRFLASMPAHPRSIYVTLGSHQDLSGPEKPFPGFSYDVAHMSYVTDRRKTILGTLGLRQAPNAWGEKRDGILRRTRAMLNIHQTPSKVSEPLRIALAAAYRMPYLTEECQELYPLTEGKTCLSAPHSELQKKVSEWLSGDVAPIGHNLHQLLVHEMPFRKGVMEGLERTILWP